VRLWLRLLSCETAIERRLRSLFTQHFQVTLPQFDVMAELEHAGEKLTMSQLSKELMVSNGNVTGVVDRLEKRGFVTRLRPSFDGRVQFIELTKKGAQEFKRMAAQHDRWQADFLSELSLSEMDKLEQLLLKARQSVLKKG
jgi:DNA-binding MarR family transcriptional regulator